MENHRFPIFHMLIYCRTTIGFLKKKSLIIDHRFLSTIVYHKPIPESPPKWELSSGSRTIRFSSCSFTDSKAWVDSRAGSTGMVGVFFSAKKIGTRKNTCLGLIFGEIVLIYQSTIGSRLDLELPENDKNGRYMQ